MVFRSQLDVLQVVKIMTQQHKIENELEKIYFNTYLPGSYGGVKSLYRTAKPNNVPNITEANVRSFLSKQRA